MSITELNKINNYSFRRRHDSGELDVFEAARYFSGVHENPDHDYNMIHIFPHKSIREEIQRPAERMRLDSMIRSPIPPQSHAIMHQKKIKEIKKIKQPSSPGGRLAGFLNSLFSHTSSNKCKSKSIGAITDLEQTAPFHGGRRIGRSSKIYSRNPNDTASAADLKSMHSCSSSGFRTPPLRFSNVPTKPDDEFVRFFYPKNGGNLKAKSLHDAFYFDKISTDYFALSVEEKLRIKNNYSAVNWIDDDDEYPSEEKGFRKFSDDGADTDSSSDLFDLPNHDLDHVHGNGLPVYETTLMNNIRRGSLV
ncbi:protein BIG GRAIN 1-like E [Henckelia pumila]|uniref:protein BIG GRAIN 1-like E n=1 Tax=Henckelia pumila TaxID=405737 RepID=UPI003C6E795F